MALAALACLALLLNPAQVPQTNAEKLALYNHIRQCTVKVFSEFGDKHYHGTGVGYKRYGDFVMVITNSHVVAEDGATSPKLEVQPYSKTERVFLPAYALFDLKDDALFFDLAFLVVRDPAHRISIAEKGTNANWKSEPVYACGHPRDEEFLVDHGNVLSKSLAPKEARDRSWVVMHDALIEHGNSGGGLFDSAGKLVGINTWLVDEKYGMAIDLGPFADLFEFRATTVFAATSDWKVDSSVPAHTTVFFLGIGKWKPSPEWQECDPGGFSNGGENALDPKFNYGSLLAHVGGTINSLNHAPLGPEGKPVIYEDARTAKIGDEGGDISFRINCKSLAECSGSLTVFYMVAFTPK